MNCNLTSGTLQADWASDCFATNGHLLKLEEHDLDSIDLENRTINIKEQFEVKWEPLVYVK